MDRLRGHPVHTRDGASHGFRRACVYLFSRTYLRSGKQQAGHGTLRKPRNSPPDGSVRQVKTCLTKTLPDPKSMEYIEWSEVRQAPEGVESGVHTTCRKRLAPIPVPFDIEECLDIVVEQSEQNDDQAPLPNAEKSTTARISFSPASLFLRLC